MPLVAFAAMVVAHPAMADAPVEFVPPRAAMVVAIDDPVQLMETVLRLPIDRLEDAVPAVRGAMMSPQILAARGGLMWVEGQLGSNYREILTVAAGSGIAIGVERENLLVIVTRSPQPDRLESLLRASAQLAAGMKVGRDAPAPESTGVHRGIKAYKIGELVAATAGGCLVMASNGELAKSTLDRILDGGDRSLWSGLPAGDASSIRMMIRHNALPAADQQITEATKRGDDFARELLLGGAISALDVDGSSSAIVDLRDDHLDLNLRITRPTNNGNENSDASTGDDADSQDRLREIRQQILLGTEQDGVRRGKQELTADDLPQLADGQIAQLTLDRDLSLLWSEKDALLSERAAAQLDVADSQLSTAFGGFDFGDEVLGALAPSFRIVVFQPANAESAPPVLPEAGVIGGLRAASPDQVARRFRIAWQTIIGIVNVERGGNGQPQLELETMTEDGVRMMTGRYSLRDAQELNADSVDLYATLSPTIGTSENRIAIATSDILAKRLLENEQWIPQLGDGGLVTIAIDGAETANLLKLNKPALLAQNMLENGNSRAEAETAIQSLIGAVGMVEKFGLRSQVTEDGLVGIARLSWTAKDTEKSNGEPQE
jgi:hypothetical protein